MIELTAEQKIRYQLTGHPYTDPTYQHEGPDVIRWITGGTDPSIYAKIQHENDQTVLYCPQCGKKLGQFNDSRGNAVYQKIAEIRETGSKHQQQHQTPN